jgi:3'-phosphoadenosine 5'-phosphosulfate sulfotransferase (PAPS reductase)/FAD synthetase
MTALARAAAIAHTRTRPYLAHLQRACETIDWAYTHCRPFVGFSAGKDSSVMLWLTLGLYPNAVAQVLTGGETRILYPSLDSILSWWRERWPAADIREVNVDHVFAPGWERADWRTQNDTFLDGWARYLHASGEWDGVFIGLREAESNTRRMALRHNRLPDCQYAVYRYRLDKGNAEAGHYRICPLDRWTDDDIAAAMWAYELPQLETYQTEGLQARTHLRTGFTAMRMGQVAELRRRDRPAYNRLLQRFPELKKWT